jgi:Holliday junction resolvase RusA-like endonuclease
MLELTVPLSPISWKSPLKGKHTFYDPVGKDKNAFRFYLREQYRDKLITGFVVLKFTFISKIPKSYSKKKRAQIAAGELYPLRYDCTNCQKFAEDCLKNIVIEDDRYVAKIFSEKIYGDQEQIQIKIYPLKEFLDAANSR